MHDVCHRLVLLSGENNNYFRGWHSATDIDTHWSTKDIICPSIPLVQSKIIQQLLAKFSMKFLRQGVNQSLSRCRFTVQYLISPSDGTPITLGMMIHDQAVLCFNYIPHSNCVNIFFSFTLWEEQQWLFHYWIRHYLVQSLYWCFNLW